MDKPYKDRDWLCQKYIIEKLGAPEIANLAGCHYDTIYRWLRKYGIEVRTRSEAGIVIWDNQEKRKGRSQQTSELWKDPEWRDNQARVRNSEEFHDKQSKAVKRAYERVPGYRERISEMSKELWRDPEYIAKIRKHTWDNHEFRERHLKRMAQLWSDPGYRKFMQPYQAAGLKKAWEDPDFRERKARVMSERVRELWQDPEFRATQSERMRREASARWQDGEYREMMRKKTIESWKNPARRERARKLMLERWNDDEWRAFMATMTQELWANPEYREAHTGSNNPGWRGGHEKYRGPNWKQQAACARARDKYMCQVCGLPQKKNGQKLDVHHIIPFAAFEYIPEKNENYKQANNLKNLVTLCRTCHRLAELGIVPVQLSLL